ncbi:MAG: DUF4091 domain-containing protein [Armatimonadota bacterium]|nr:DUF4091 domain-containing protein [bacterium]MDW8321449.1 DUF4091 domain-containing protein [Armatimonadota bacterium]
MWVLMLIGITLLLCLQLSAQTQQAGASITWWVAPSAQKVFRGDSPPANPVRFVSLSAARGEREAAQVVLRAESSRQLLHAEVSNLTNEQGYRLPKDVVTLYRVAYVYLPAHQKEYPDPLPPLRIPLSLEPAQCQPLWLSVEVPRDAQPGLYRGGLELQFTDGERHRVPIEVRVWNFDIPLTPSMRTAFGLWGDGIARHHGVSLDSKAHQKLLERYWEWLVSRRISPYSIPVDIFSPEASKYLGDPRLTSFVIPYSDDEAQLRRTVEHLRQGGWLHKGYFYVVDEPITREQYDRLIQTCAKIKKVDPSLKIVSPYYRNPDFDKDKTPFDLLAGYINIWCPNTAFFHPEQLRKRQQQGEEVWWYVCCGPGKPFANFFVDMDGTAHRILFWQQKAFGVQGLLYWNTVWWNPTSTEDPWQDIATVKDINPNVYGDGSLVYPGKRAGVYGPVTSIRLELLCDGAEDYEYLTLYEKEFGEAATQKVIRELTQSLTEFESDPARLEAVRERIGRALDAKHVRK